jgi:UDP-N-acetylmuramyl pentapeptide phosphotransferase/UDP-N-acetylglucosamine-1-phosphate transferase
MGNVTPLVQVLPWMSGGAVVLGGLGVWDDLHDLSPWKRLPVQALVALMVLLAGYSLPALRLPGLEWSLPVIPASLVSFLFILWMINLYNFMDGMDGFAGGMTVIGFGTLAWLGNGAGHPGFAFLALVVAAAGAGFLWFNFPPARIFMGDAGAPVLGFLAAVFLLWAERDGLFPLWVGLLLFAPFVVDASYTLARRMLRGEALWQAHCGHLYQKLVRSGWSHRRTVFWSYLLMLACAGSAVVAVQAPVAVQWGMLAGWGGLFLLLILGIERLAGVLA